MVRAANQPEPNEPIQQSYVKEYPRVSERGSGGGQEGVRRAQSDALQGSTRTCRHVLENLGRRSSRNKRGIKLHPSLYPTRLLIRPVYAPSPPYRR
eukprot:2561916-Pyramimonas_sp.AAC.1